MEPNIFKYATKELSQDAFFCWLLSWSEEKYRNIHPELFNRSRTFLSHIISEDILGEDEAITSLKVMKQYKNIDFFYCN